MVRRHHWYILGVILFFASYFTVRFISPEVAPVSSVFMLLFALPSFYYAYKTSSRALYAITAVSIFSYIVETTGILTGFPYSAFEYSDLIAWKLFGVTPAMLPFAFVPLVIATMYLVQEKKVWQQILFSALLLVTIDLLLDPAAVALGLWIWEDTSFYYAIPLLNFAGWLFSGLIASSIWASFKLPKLPKESTYSLFLTLAFWTGASLWMQLWIPLLIGVALLTWLIVLYELQ